MKILKSDFKKYSILSRLNEIKDTPEFLNIEGENIELLDNKSGGKKYLCIVGSRKCTHYSKDVIDNLVSKLPSNVVIISGLALGVDAYAHSSAIKYGLATIAVPGSGLDRDILHPQTNVKLANDIISNNGLLISEYSNNFKATLYSFPARNRIMAAMCDALLIVESEEKSGTQITARLALEYGRDIGIIPGSIFWPNSVGTMKLWKDGATPICDISDLLELLRIGNSNNQGSLDLMPALSEKEKAIYDLLIEPLDKESLIASAGLSFTDGLVALMTLEGKGVIKEQFGEIRRVI